MKLATDLIKVTLITKLKLHKHPDCNDNDNHTIRNHVSSYNITCLLSRLEREV